MSQRDVLRRILALLESAQIPHMLAGSLASTFHGLPRSTQDIDLVIDPTPQSLDAFLAAIPAGHYYVSPEAAREALASRGQFNLIDQASGWKVDLIVRKQRRFSEEEFERRRRELVLGEPVCIATAEDTVLAKLEWARLGESERQLRDVAGVISVRAGELDRDYIERWASQLGVTELWQRALELAEGPDPEH